MTTDAPRVALITGGSRGIGLGIARALAADGFRLALTGRRPPADVKPVVDELMAVAPGVLYVPSDVGDLSEHPRVLQQVRDRFGRLDVLVNNAGIATTRTPRTSPSNTGTTRSPSISPRRSCARARRSRS